MNEEPKACPFCGKPPQGNNWHTYGRNPKDEMRYFCANHDCPNGLRKAVTLDEWNTRPLEDALRADLAAAQAEVERLRDMELQADVEHEIWSSWMRYMFTCGTFNDDETWTMPSDKVERWRRQADTPYSELSEREKESDREQVRKHWEAK